MLAIAEFGEHVELDGGEENLGRPEGEGRLENGTGIEVRARVMHTLITTDHYMKMSGRLCGRVSEMILLDRRLGDQPRGQQFVCKTSSGTAAAITVE